MKLTAAKQTELGRECLKVWGYVEADIISSVYDA